MNGPILEITGVAAGTATFTVTATNNTNAIGAATQNFGVTVTSLVPMASGIPAPQSPVTVTAATTTPIAGGPTVPAGGPSVNAYSDQAVTTGASVSLTGYGSPVDDDDDASYNWTQQSGTTVNLTAAVTGLPYTSGLAVRNL